MADFNFGGINSLLRQLPGSAQQITNAISRGFGSMPSATRQLPPGAARIGQQLPNAISPSPLSVRFNPAANLPYPPQAPFIDERIYNATRTGLTNARNALGAAVDTGRGVTNILGRAAGPSMEAVRGGFGSAGSTLSNMAGGARNTLEGVAKTNLGNELWLRSRQAQGANPLAAGAAGSLGRGLLGRAAVVGDMYATGKKVFNPADNILTSVQNLGTGIQNQFRSPQEKQSYVGSDPVAVLGNKKIAAEKNNFTSSPSQKTNGYSSYGTYTVGGIEYDINSGRPTYLPQGSSYSLSPSVNNFRAPASSEKPTSFTSNPAAERAYQAERSSVAQQAAQNPELQRYQDQAILARQALQGYDPASGPLPGAAQQAQDMGMAMWAKANPGLAAKVRPGQSGFGAIQNTLASSAATAGLQMPGQLTPTPQIPGTTSFPTAIPQSGFQAPGAPAQDQLSTYPQFDPKKVDIGLFSKFMQANPKK
jgi:hypothetical protein